VEEPELKQASEYFEHSIASGDFSGFCDMKSKEYADAGDNYESTMWSFMRIIFGKFSRCWIKNKPTFLHFEFILNNQTKF